MAGASFAQPPQVPEEWRDVVGYEGLYAVSNLGRFKRLARTIVDRTPSGTMRTRVYPERIRKPSIMRKRGGYLYVSLRKNGKIATRCVHLLVAEAFIGPRPPGAHTCHRNGDPTDAHAVNLRYDTPRGNAMDKVPHGTHRRGERSSTSKLTEDDVRFIRGSELGEKELASIFGVSRSLIGLIKRRQRWGWLI